MFIFIVYLITEFFSWDFERTVIRTIYIFFEAWDESRESFFLAARTCDSAQWVKSNFWWSLARTLIGFDNCSASSCCFHELERFLFLFCLKRTAHFVDVFWADIRTVAFDNFQLKFTFSEKGFLVLFPVKLRAFSITSFKGCFFNYENWWPSESFNFC